MLVVNSPGPDGLYVAIGENHPWEGGANGNTHGLIRQYLPKGANMDDATQQDCSLIAHALNYRPGKRLGFKDPEECLNES